MTGSGFTHESPYQGTTNIWLTPRYIIDDLGEFDLDPCAAPAPRPWPTAAKHYVEAEDGLSKEWEGFVFCNPPYGPHTGTWLARLAGHKDGGVALTFARTETRAFFDSVWAKAGGLLFIKGRLKFCKPDGTSGANAAAPSVLIGYGDKALRRLANSKIDGHLVVNAAAIVLGDDGRPVETWREVVARAMSGKQMRLKDLYTELEATGKVRYSKAKGVEWRSKIRRTLQEHFAPVQRGVWAAV